MSTNETLIQAIMACAGCVERCKANNNAEWLPRWQKRLTSLYALLPSGSGIDNGTKIRTMESWKLTLIADFHHMNDQGVYDGWTEHVVTVRPDWRGIRVNVSGPNRDKIRDHLVELYQCTLDALVECDGDTDTYRFVPDEPVFDEVPDPRSWAGAQLAEEKRATEGK
jgi:hypothetical protein